LDEASGIDMQPLIPSTKILQWQLGQNLQCKGVVSVTTIIEGSKMCLEYHIFHHPGPTFILVGVKDELEEDLLQQVMETTPKEELSPPCLDDVADYFSLAEEEAEFKDLEQKVNPKTSPVELKQLPPGLQYVFLNGDHETPVNISDKLSNDEARRLVATLEKYQ
jgi:hypothetical protein